MKLRQLLCGLLHGHDNLLHFESGKLSLKCYSCSWESAGWLVAKEPDAPRPAWFKGHARIFARL